MFTLKNIKLLLSEKILTFKALAEELQKRTHKNYTSYGLSQKMEKNNLTFKEIRLISEILCYEIKFEKK